MKKRKELSLKAMLFEMRVNNTLKGILVANEEVARSRRLSYIKQVRDCKKGR